MLAGLVASQFIVRGNLSSAQGGLAAPESVLNKKNAITNKTENSVDCFDVEKIDLSKKLENDVTIKTDPDLNKKAINKGDIKFSKEELDSKELAKRLIIPIFSFASIGVATSFIKHLVDSKNEQQNKKEDDPIPGPNQEDDPIPGPNQEDDPGNNFLKIVIYTFFPVILLWLFGKFFIAPQAVLEVYGKKELFWLNLLTKLKVRPKKVIFMINGDDIKEIDDFAPPDFIKNAAKKGLIRYGDQIKIDKNILKSITDTGIFVRNITDTFVKKIDVCLSIPGFFIKAEGEEGEYEFVDFAKIAGMCENIEKSGEETLEQAKKNRDKSEALFCLMSNSEEKNRYLKMAIHGIVAPYGDLVDMTWTRCAKNYIEYAIKFLESDEKTKDNLYIKGRIAATELYRQIILNAGFVLAKDSEALNINDSGAGPGGVEVFQMLLCMEKFLSGNNLVKFDLPVYKSLLIEFYYYSIINTLQSKDKKNIKNDEWNKKVFEKLKELKGIGENLNKEGLIEKIRNLKKFLLEINSEIKADELNGKVYGSIQNNYQ